MSSVFLAADESRELRRSYLRTIGGPTAFLTTGFDMVIAEFTRIVMTSTIESFDGLVYFSRVRYEEPKVDDLSTAMAGRGTERLFPDTCRKRQMSYLSAVIFDVHVVPTTAAGLVPLIDGQLDVDRATVLLGGALTTVRDVSIGKIPVMLRSNLCNLSRSTGNHGEVDLDPGARFVVNGVDKVLLMQERLCPGLSIVYYDRDDRLGVFMICRVGLQTRKVGMVVYVPPKRAETSVNVSKLPTVRLTTQSLSHDDPAARKSDPGINVGLVYALLGFSGEDALLHLRKFLPRTPSGDISYAVVRAWLTSTFDEAAAVTNVRAALIARDKDARDLRGDPEEAYRTAYTNLMKDLYPHIPANNTSERINLLSLMLVQLAMVATNQEDPTDRNNWSFKYLQTGPTMIGFMMSQMWTYSIERLRRVLAAAAGGSVTQRIENHFRREANDFTSSLVNAIRSGTWGIKSTRATWDGITEELTRMSQVAIYSHLLRINTPSEHRGAQVAQRQVQPSQLALVDPNVTPDSETIGLTKTVAGLAQVSFEVPDAYIWERILDRPDLFAYDRPEAADAPAGYVLEHLLIINGRPRAWCNGPAMRQYLRSLRRMQAIHPTVSLFIDNTILRVSTVAGRLYAPFLIVSPTGELVMDSLPANQREFNDLLTYGAAEYMDAQEIELAVIAQSIDDFRKFPHLRANLQYDLDVVNQVIAANGVGAPPDVRDTAELIREELFVAATGITTSAVYRQLMANTQDEERKDLIEAVAINDTEDLDEAAVIAVRVEMEALRTNLLNAARDVQKYQISVLTAYQTMRQNLEQRIDHLTTETAYTHVLLDPTEISSVSVAATPMYNMMQPARVAIQGNMATQSISVAQPNENRRIEPRKTIMYGEAPIVYTQQGQDVGQDMYAAGEHLRVLIAPYKGYTEEDGMVYNRRSALNGVLRGTNYFAVWAEEEENQGVITTFYRPLYTVGRGNTSKDPFRYLEADGLVEQGVPVSEGDCLIGIASYNKSQQYAMAQYFTKLDEVHSYRDVIEAVNNGMYQPLLDYKAQVRAYTVSIGETPEAIEAEDTAVTGYRTALLTWADTNYVMKLAELNALQAPENRGVYVEWDEEGIIDQVQISMTAANRRRVDISIRRMTSPLDGGGGNKLTAGRDAQKGTVSRAYNPEDLPFSERDGSVPDLIINPTCVPSRMTVNMLREAVIGKHHSMRGLRFDATAFREFDERYIYEELREMGFSESGVETFYNPINGRVMTGTLFVGPIHVQKLRHLVDDKWRARGEGQNDPVTGAPVRGRKRGGGLRCGEMDAHCLEAVGAAAALRDRLGSDLMPVIMCRTCGVSVSVVAYIELGVRCHRCNGKDFVKVDFPTSYIYTTMLIGASNVLTHYILSKQDLGTRGILTELTAPPRPVESAADEAAAALGALALDVCPIPVAGTDAGNFLALDPYVSNIDDNFGENPDVYTFAKYNYRD